MLVEVERKILVRLNIGELPSKPKYFLEFDSEQCTVKESWNRTL